VAKDVQDRVGNNSRKPRDLSGYGHSDSLKKGQLTLSRDKVNKGDDVNDDVDNDLVRTSVPQVSE
jgi:hypothetical protein